MIGIFLFGCFVTAIVTAACGLIIAGIRADRRELEELGEQDGGHRLSPEDPGP
jgi:hypothetical protein